MKVVFAPDAKADLLDILEFIARDNPRIASRFVRQLRDAAIEIGEHPRAWPLIPRYEAKGYRRRICRGHLLIYELFGAEVRVLRILNGAQDYERILFPQDDAP
jgi:plasmid stabilization system protein ParE